MMKTFVITEDHVMMNVFVADALSQCQVHLYVQFVTILWFTRQTVKEGSFTDVPNIMVVLVIDGHKDEIQDQTL